MKLLNSSILSLALIATLTACSDGNEPETVDNRPYHRIDLPENTRANVKSGNDFALWLARQISQDSPEDVFFSPFSISSVLAIMANADEGESKEIILKALCADDKDLESLNSYYKIMGSELHELDNRVIFISANSIWHEAYMKVMPSFLERTKPVFSLEEFNETPKTTNGVKQINEWVRTNTKGMIPEFLQETIDIDIAVINSTYFKGKWEEPFNRDLTERGVFNNIDGTESNAMFMHRQDKLMYAHSDGKHMLELPYGNGNFIMYVIMPDSPEDFHSMTESLDSDVLASMTESLETYNVNLFMPKFETESETDLSDIFSALGFSSPDQIELSSLLESGNYAIKPVIKHKATITVDEEGSTASAATIIGGITSPGPVKDITLRINRPFLYMIQEHSTGSILFIGHKKSF